MNKKSLFRKIAYIVAIVLLLLPLFALGKPGTGLIGQLRTKHRIGQANLGKLDPTSESMRLATLGMKGVAATILWGRADYYKEEKYFDRFSATLNQISLLQPHFVSVWQFQAHNLGYNVSPEFEDYRQRYEWVKKGIDYMVRGTKFNDRKPILQYDLGQQYFGHKMGKADEKVQYRNLYRNDDEFHSYLKDQGLVGIDTTARGFDQKPDNWLTGKLWLNQATDLYQSGALIKKVPHLLFSYSPAWRMYYAEAIESEGVLDASASLAWKLGGEEWAQFGSRSLYQFGQGRDVTLLGIKEINNELTERKTQFDEISKEARPAAIADLRKDIDPEDLKVFDLPESERTQENYALYTSVMNRLTPTFQQIAAKLPPEQQAKLVKIATEMSTSEEFLKQVKSYRSQVNYDYWELRANLEQKDEAIKARRLVYEADKLIDEADVKGAVDLYDEAWVYWDWIFNRYPSMMTEEMGDDVQRALARYSKLVDEEVSESFPLNRFLEIRRFHNSDAFSSEATRLIEEIQRKVGELPDTPPVYVPSQGKEQPTSNASDVPAAVAPTPEAPAAEAPVAAEEPVVATSVPSEGDMEQAKSSPEASPSQASETEEKVQEAVARPPTLENPDSQN